MERDSLTVEGIGVPGVRVSDGGSSSRLRRTTAEAVATACLLVTIVGSGIMGERLAGGNEAIALLANAIATGAGLIALILTFGPISGAHMNPAVSLVAAFQHELPWRDVPWFAAAQFLGALIGVGVADVMFGERVFSVSQHVRSGPPLILSEALATFGLVAAIVGCARRRPDAIPFVVGAYITAGYWCTPSTSFANPAVTVARTVTDTFTGIRPVDAPAFIAAQLVGAAAGMYFFRWLHAERASFEQ